ncbi:S1 family peptidase [Gordonia sp. NPDC003424]
MAAVGFGLAATHPVAVAEPAKVSIADTVGPSLVFISTEYKGRVQIPFTSGATWTDEMTLTSSCTGYIVDPTGYIATAGHCVNAGDPEIADAFRQEAVVAIAKAQNRDITWARDTLELAKTDAWPVKGDAQTSNVPDRSVSIEQPSGPKRIFADPTTVQVIDFQEFKEGDNAVLKVNNTSGPLPALVISSAVPEPGDPCTSIGFPAAVQGTNDTSTIAQPSYKTGTVSSRQTGDAGIARTEVSAEMGKGMSGGPTVDPDGAVIGTNSSGSSLADDNATFNFITDNIALRSYLQSHGVQLQAAKADDSSGAGIWLWLGPVIGVVVVLVIILAVMLGRRGRQRPVPPQYGPPGYGPGGGPQFGSSPYGTQGFSPTGPAPSGPSRSAPGGPPQPSYPQPPVNRPASQQFAQPQRQPQAQPPGPRPAAPMPPGPQRQPPVTPGQAPPGSPHPGSPPPGATPQRPGGQQYPPQNPYPGAPGGQPPQGPYPGPPRR